MKSNAQIEVQCGDSNKAGQSNCVVTVTEGDRQTKHSVIVDEAYRKNVAGEGTFLEELLRQSFYFLLEREPKESILREFDLRVISRYFPEYETEIRRMLGSSSM